jgi:glycosyltransferase involved in cell wall biosynthesis
MPRFSIVITCYNQRRFIREAVDSALMQDCSDREVIVVDDGSTDGSVEVLSKYGDKIKLCLSEANQGAGTARNKGASIATGQYVTFLDGDDILLPCALSVYWRIIELKQPKILIPRLLHFEGTFDNGNAAANLKELEIIEYETLMNKDRFVRFTAAAVIDRQCFDRSGGWATDMFHMDDHDLLLRLGYAGRTIQMLTPRTIAYRSHESNSTKQIDRMLQGALKLIDNEKAGRYPGGENNRYLRYGMIGGFALYWLRRAFRENLYGQVWHGLIANREIVSIALLKKSFALARRRKPKQVIPLIEASTVAGDGGTGF